MPQLAGHDGVLCRLNRSSAFEDHALDTVVVEKASGRGVWALDEVVIGVGLEFAHGLAVGVTTRIHDVAAPLPVDEAPEVAVA